jgi:hypothetical protein
MFGSFFVLVVTSLALDDEVTRYTEGKEKLPAGDG